MKYVSLFSGIGGFDLGFDRAGMECQVQVEIEERCRTVLERHWPNVRRLEDVRSVSTACLPRVDLICGGFPCQDVSQAGRRAGLAGVRSGLFWEFLRLIEGMRPEWVIFENVRGLLSSASGRDMATILGALAECGYGWAYRVLDAQYFGLAQRRKRVFIVGCLTEGRAAQVLFESESGGGHFVSSRQARTGDSTDVAACLNSGGNNGGFRTEPGEHLVVNALTQSDGGADDNAAQAGHLIPVDFQQLTHPDNRSNPQPGDPAPTMNTGSKPLSVIGFNKLQDPVPADELSPALGRKSGGMGVLEGVQVRNLTPIECERLQGFPDDWTAGQSDSARYRQLGNAVAVPVAEWLGRRILTTSRKKGKIA